MKRKCRNNGSSYCYLKNMSIKRAIIFGITLLLNGLCYAQQSSFQSAPATQGPYFEFTKSNCLFNIEEALKLLYYKCLSENEKILKEKFNTSESEKLVGSFCINKQTFLVGDLLNEKTKYDYPYFSNAQDYAKNINSYHQDFKFNKEALWRSIFINQSNKCLSEPAENRKMNQENLAIELVEKHLALPLYYMSYIKNIESQYETHSLEIQSNKHKNYIKIEDQVSFGNFLYTNNLISSLHPIDKNSLIFPVEFYNTFAVLRTNGYGKRIVFSNFDNSTKANESIINQHIENLTSALNDKNINKEEVFFANLQNDYYLLILNETISNEEFNKSVKDYAKYYTSFTANTAFAYNYFKAYIANFKNITSVANYTVAHFDPELANYIKKSLGWSSKQLLHELNIYSKYLAQFKNLENKSKVEEKLTHSNFETWLKTNNRYFLIFALNLKQSSSFNLDVAKEDSTNEDFLLSLKDLKLHYKQNEAFEVFNSINEIIELLNKLNFEPNEIKQIALNSLRQHINLQASTSAISWNYKKILSELEKMPAGIFSEKIMSLYRSLSSDFELGSLSINNCSVAQVVSTKNFEGKIFQQHGVATLVALPNGREQWITPAHVVADADEIRIKCGTQEDFARITFIDSLKDFAFLKTKSPIKFSKSLPIAPKNSTNSKYFFLYPYTAIDKNVDLLPELYSLSEKSKVTFLDNNFIGSPYFGINKIVRLENFGIRPGMSGSPIINSDGQLIAMATHTSLTKAESLAIRSEEFLNINNETNFLIHNNYTIENFKLIKRAQLSFSKNERNYFIQEACSSNSYQSSSQWQPVNGKTDWGGGSSGKLAVGTYIPSQSLNQTYGQYIPTFENCREGGLYVNQKKFNLVSLKDSNGGEHLHKIESLIDLLQLITKYGFNNIISKLNYNYSDTALYLCGHSKEKKYSSSIVQNFLNIYKGINGDVKIQSDIFDMNLSDIRHSDRQVLCNNNFLTINLPNKLELNITGDLISGSITVGHCTEVFKENLNSFSPTIFTDSFKINFNFTFSPEKQISYLIYDVKPHCKINNRIDILQTKFLFKNK